MGTVRFILSRSMLPSVFALRKNYDYNDRISSSLYELLINSDHNQK